MVVQCSGFEWAAKATISFTSAAKQVASPRPEAIQATCSLFIRPSPTNQYLDASTHPPQLKEDIVQAH